MGSRFMLQVACGVACLGFAAPCAAGREDGGPRDAAPPVGPKLARLPRTIISVSYVREGGLASKIGVRRGDVLLSLGSRPILKDREGDSPYAPKGTNIAKLADSLGPRQKKLALVRAGLRVELDVPGAPEGDAWKMRVLFTENILPRVFAVRGVTPELASTVERSVHEAASLRWIAATRLAEEAVGKGLEDAGVFAYLAECCNHVPWYEKAEGYCGRALALDPRNAAATRALAYKHTLTGRPALGVELFAKLRRLLQAGGLDKNDRRAEKLARSQLPWVKAAALDDRRRELGILPDLLDPRTGRREIVVANLVPVFWATIHSFRRPGHRAGTFWTAAIVSNASVSAEMCEVTVYEPCWSFQNAGFWFSQEKDFLYFGVCPNGDAIVWTRHTVCRMIGLSCVRPGVEGNRIRVFRHGSRWDCFVNGNRILTCYQPDEPARYYWSLTGMKATFVRMKLEVPDPDAPPRDPLEAGGETWLPDELAPADEDEQEVEEVF